MPDRSERDIKEPLKYGIPKQSYAGENAIGSIIESSDEQHAENDWIDPLEEESLEDESQSDYDSDDVLTDESDFIDDSEDLDDFDNSDGSYDPADPVHPNHSNTSDDSDTSSNWSDAYSPTK
ncbi:hypothetical protein DPSP01_014138, partial [Paraphaeosphaeria sporulosa]